MKMPDAKWKKRIIWGLVALFAIVLLIVAWIPSPLDVDAAPAALGPLTVTVDEDGATRVIDRYTLAAPLSGVLERVELRPGDRVDAGDDVVAMRPAAAPLLDPRTRAQAEAQVSTARAALEQARAGFEQAREAEAFASTEAERVEQLLAGGVVTRQDNERARFEAQTAGVQLESARFAVQVARHQLATAEAVLAQADGEPDADDQQVFAISAPIDAVVLQVFQESAVPVQAGTPLLELGDPRNLEVVVDVLTTSAVGIEPDNPVLIERWGGPETIRGHVRRIEPAAFTRISSLGVEEQRVNVIIDVDQPSEQWQQLGDGYRVEARIVTWHADDVLKVDASAVFRRGEGWAVYQVVDGRARLTPVTVGQRTEREVQILEGLQAGDDVILYPSDAVEDGARVRERETPVS
ncbi:MAG: HlyD family efflux transporter periplasmic adaptor subunit [Bradymonadaceae bacterium]|nr:HlyD family efflux transporter periplasmic adaptor subunit [Lujinxingiaceae bacterium]